VSLTSSGFQLAAILSVIVVTAATLLLWNRVPGPRAVRISARIVMLGTGYLVAGIAALVSINIAYGGLIASWSDLADNLGGPPSTAHSHPHGHG